MKRILSVSLIIFIAISCKQGKPKQELEKLNETNNQIQFLYHEFEETASDIHIVKWNIDKNELPSNYVLETVDSKGRVIELKFFKNNTLKYDRLCYLSVWVKYEYPNENKIIAYFLNSEGNEDADFECEMPSKCIYELSADKKIILDTKSEYNINKEFYLNNGWVEEELNKTLEYLNSEQNIHRIISYYDKSFNKMNKLFPVSNEFIINDFVFSELEKEEGLK
jgi:hypothetical protein